MDRMDKRPIVVVENDRSWLEDNLTKLIVEECGFEGEIDDLTKSWSSPAGLARLRASQLAILDLELGAATGGGITDMRGRDDVLPVFRREARWVPIVLMSQYVTNNDFLLADLTPSDFDAVVGKRFITDSRTIPSVWRQFVRKCSLRRVASLTGRSMGELEYLLSNCPALEYGHGVREQIDGWSESDFREVMSLLDLGAPRLVIDRLIQGFSGVSVFRVVAEGQGATRKWLLKTSRAVAKVDGEARAHRAMVQDGLTRMVTVPLLWHAAVCWKDCAVIAYEFEDDSETLLDCALRIGTLEALELVAPSLELLFEGTYPSYVVPRSQLRPIAPKTLDDDLTAGVYDSVVSPVIRDDDAADRIDASKRLRVGRVHGDLHARNILVASKKGVFIDFAHFRPASERGVPLCDIAKLFVDLSAFATPPWSVPSLCSGKVLEDERVARLLKRIGAIDNGRANESERDFFGDACACLMASYLEYDDVPTTVRESFKTALATPTILP